MISIRAFHADDWAALWPILQATFAAGDTYTFARDASEAEIHAAWVKAPLATFVAEDEDGRLLGSYYLKPNQPGGGAHVVNCGYVVAADAAGRGVATRMCQHSLAYAREKGFLAMQFNFVVASNTRAVALWQRLGFEVVGRLPQAFRHPQLGLVDALVMYQWLGES